MRLNRPATPELEANFALTVDHLTVQTAQDVLLDDVSLRINPGEYVAIVGPSGSGKTTLANHMLGIGIDNQPPAEGEVRYGDLSIFGLKDAARTALRGRHFGYVPQHANLISDMTAAENIVLPARMKNLTVNQDELDYAVDLMGIAGRLDHTAGTLSGGEQQRVSIVRALAHDPSVVVLDEPTAALNKELKLETNEMLKKLASDIGKTIIVVTHEDTTATRTVKLNSGKLVDDTARMDRVPVLQWGVKPSVSEIAV
jgi:putative ABC transport system ATP-binding protein